MFLDTAALFQLQVYAIIQIQNHLTLVCLFFLFFFQADELNAVSSLSLQWIYPIFFFLLLIDVGGQNPFQSVLTCIFP